VRVVSASRGEDESHVHIPSPKAPAIIALNKTTGKLVWEHNSVDDRILHGQWSTPAAGRLGGVDQVVSAQGDGWVRGYEAATGKKLWEFDTNPKESVWPRTRNEVIATPVLYEDRVYIANGQEPVLGGLGVDARSRLQGVHRRRRRRRVCSAGGQGEKGAGPDEHGERRVCDAGAGPRRAVPQ